MENQTENLRFALALNRIREIPRETGAVSGAFQGYFQETAQEILTIVDTARYLRAKEAETADPALLKEKNRALYADILPEHYEKSWCCPKKAGEALGEELGPYLCAIAFEMRSMIPFLFEGEEEHALIRMELFLEVYRCFEDAKKGADDAIERGETDAAALAVPKARFVRGILAGYVSDYAQDELSYDLYCRLVAGSPSLNAMMEEADLSDPRYLYRSGFYISQNEMGTAAHLQELSEDTLAKMADTFTEGYRIGFETTGKDLSKKHTVDLVYTAGFERMMRRAQENFKALGKHCIAHRELSTIFQQMGRTNGVTGGAANHQADYDHREDLSLVLDDTLANRMMESLREAFRTVERSAHEYAGPAVVEPYGEKPFAPKETKGRCSFDKLQNRQVTKYRQKFTDLYNEAVIGENRSFTIISFPLPEIAEDAKTYGEIFDETIRLNTLDYRLYQTIQGKIIDALNVCDHVIVKGRGKNRTDLTVALYQPADPDKEDIFENCVADVNIPVGEVFTTPVLEGTNGLLHVTGVYLDGLYYKDLAISFEDGCTKDYACANFAGEENAEEKGRAYIEENILFHHKFLPMGECAIGTNTTAYAVGEKYGISGRYGILIAEKTGPHFAVGDTCYSHEEDLVTRNPDGKIIAARENDFSRKRKENPEEAYFGCHTDITIPYRELGLFAGVKADGTEVPIIENGKFVLPGTEDLNPPLSGIV